MFYARKRLMIPESEQSLLSHPELIRDLLGQYIHIPAYFVVGDFRINLRGGNMLMP